MPSECNYYSDTERNLDKPIRKSMQFETFKKLDFGDAKHSLTSDLLLRAKILGQLSQLKSGTKLCNECIHHVVKDNTLADKSHDNCKHNNLLNARVSPIPEHTSFSIASNSMEKELNHKAQEQALAIGEREAALRAEEDLRDQVEALSKECEGIRCDRDVALLALKQSVALKGEQDKEELEALKKQLQEYEVRDEVALSECQQVRQENARMRMMYDLDRSAANRESAALQEQLKRLMSERDKVSKERDDYKYQKDVIARDFNELVKQFKEPEMSDDSAIQEDQAPDGQSSNSDPSTVVIDKIDPGTLRDVVFAEGRMLTSGKKVNLIVRKDKPMVSHSEKMKQLSHMEGLHHVITTESPVKRLSDIKLKHSGKRSLGKPVIKDTSVVSTVDPVVRSVTMATPIKTVALSTSNTPTITAVPAVGEIRTITITLEETKPNIGFEIVSGNTKSEGIFISKLLDQRLGKGKNTLNIGDEILEANGVKVSAMSEGMAMETILQSSTVTISVKYNPSGYLSARYKFYVRALFDFKAISEAGLSFKFGQILQVTDVESYTYGWWQACALAGSSPGRIGEVPSKDRADLINSCNEGSASNSSCSSETGRSKNSPSKRSYQRVRAQPLSYTRPIVLMGALTSKFSKKLVNEMPGQYGYCVRYSTCKGAESELVKHCTRESVLELLKDEGRLIECKLKKGEYYYTSRESVQSVSDEGKHCVLTDGSMYMIDDLQKTGLHPIVILVKCKSAHEIRSVRNCSSDHAAKVIQKTSKLEDEHLQRFTAIVSGSNCDDIYKGIVSAINTHKDTLWLPTS